MTLETFYFAAQIIAALAVVGSLLFVGVQLRAQAREQKLTRANEGADNYSRFQKLLIENPEFREVWVKGSDDVANLTPSELLAFGAYMALWVDSAQRIQAQFDAGYTHFQTWDAAHFRYKPITRKQGAFQWWLKARNGYEPAIVPRIDALFASQGHTLPEEDSQ